MKFKSKIVGFGFSLLSLPAMGATLQELEARLQLLEKEAQQVRQEIEEQKQSQAQSQSEAQIPSPSPSLSPSPTPSPSPSPSSHPLDKNVQVNRDGNLVIKAWGSDRVISSLQVEYKANPNRKNEPAPTHTAAQTLPQETQIDIIQTPVETTTLTQEDPLQSSEPNITESQPEILQKTIVDIQAGNFSSAEIALKNYVSSGNKNDLDKVYYWLGEAAFRQNKVPQAASYFTSSYNENKQGPMAADSLMRLGMSLSQMDRMIEACRIYDVVEKDFAQMETKMSIVEGEKKRLACAPNP